MTLGDLSDLAAIATALVTGCAAAYYLCTKCSKRKRLEEYLRKEKANATDGKRGQKSIVHLMANCGMSEADILDAAFRSKRIKLPVVEDEGSGFATEILLEYDSNQNSD